MQTIDEHYYKKVFPAHRDQWVENVSRTFALSIKILPADLRAYIGHAYLVCRFLDTLEDAPDLSIPQKHEALDMAVDSLNHPEQVPKHEAYFQRLADECDVVEYEKILLAHSKELFLCLEVFPEDIRKTIRIWAGEMAQGMKKYAFGTDRPEVQLKTLEELDEYTYYVAGTVGCLLSEMFSRKKYNIPEENRKIMHANGIQFGKALQLVNIVKDSRADIKEGRCFLPEELFTKYGTDFQAFLEPGDRDKEKIKRAFEELFELARGYLGNAIEYIRVVPIRHWRIRLGCIWPVVLAYKTLMGLEKNLDGFVEGNLKFKIKRKEVKQTLMGTIWAGFSNRYFNSYIAKVAAGEKIFNI